MIRPQPKPVRAPKKPGAQFARTALKRGKPPARKTRMKRRRPRTVVDVARRDWCRAQPCIVSIGYGQCAGPIDPHHAGKNPGVGMKAPEDTTVPCCRRHHEAITGQVGGYGPFQALGEAGRRALQDEWIAESTARYLGHGGRRGR